MLFPTGKATGRKEIFEKTNCSCTYKLWSSRLSNDQKQKTRLFVDIKWTYATIRSPLEYAIKTAFQRTNVPYTAGRLVPSWAMLNSSSTICL